MLRRCIFAPAAFVVFAVATTTSGAPNRLTSADIRAIPRTIHPVGSNHLGESRTKGRITWQSWGGNGTDERWFSVRGDGLGFRELAGPPRWFGVSSAVSPDGRRVAGSSGEVIWQASIDGSSRRVIARIPGAHAVAWSPSGKQIAVVRNFDDIGRTWRRDIFVVAVDGTRNRHVATAYGYTDDPVSWSSEGRRIVYSSKHHYTDSVGTVYAVDLSSGARAALGTGDSPSYSPDGKHLAFLVKKTYQSVGVIYVADANGARRRNLKVRAFSRPVWSPASTELVGAGYEFDGLVVVRSDGTRAHRIATVVGSLIWLEWTR